MSEYRLFKVIRTDEQKYFDIEYVRDVVTCGECKYDGTWKCPWRNTQVPRYPSTNDFCSYGEREGK